MGLFARGVTALLGPPPPSSGLTIAGMALGAPLAGNFQTFARQGYQGNAIIFAGIDLISSSASEPHIVGKRWRRNRRNTPSNLLEGRRLSGGAWEAAVVSPAQAKQQVETERRWLVANGIPNRAGRRLAEAMLVRNGFYEEVPDHPLIRLLNNPNPFMSRGQLWGTATMDYHLAGNAYVLKARYRGGLLDGAVGELWRLRPDRVRVIPSRTGYIEGYEYGSGTDKVVYPARDVMHFKTRNPIDDYYGQPPLMAVLGRMAIDKYMETFLRDYYETGGTGPGAILSTKDTMEQADKEAIRDRMRRQFGVSGRMLDLMILDNAENVTYTPMGLNRGLRDALPKEIDAVSEARFAMVLGLPGSVLGLLIGYESSSYANKRQDWQVLWDVKMTPMLSDFDDVLNLSMTPEFAGVDEVCFDLSDIRALQEDEDALQDRARANFMAGGLSMQRYREQIGEPAEPAPGELFFVPSNYTVVPTERLGEEPEAPAQPAQRLAAAVQAFLPAPEVPRLGRPRIEDDVDARRIYDRAIQLKQDHPAMTWASIAGRLGIVERTLRDYRRRFEDDD